VAKAICTGAKPTRVAWIGWPRQSSTGAKPTCIGWMGWPSTSVQDGYRGKAEVYGMDRVAKAIDTGAKPICIGWIRLPNSIHIALNRARELGPGAGQKLRKTSKHLEET